MTVLSHMLQPLTEDEISAGQRYGADSTFHNAAFLGRTEELNCQPGFEEYWTNAEASRDALDRAIAKSELTTSAVLYAAHGRGFAVRGALVGQPKRFVGLQYSYPGYISTSSSIEWAEGFLKPRQFRGSRPVLLKFVLLPGFRALDMSRVGHHGEFEYLLGRNIVFDIGDAEEVVMDQVDDAVLRLTLSPAGT